MANTTLEFGRPGVYTSEVPLPVSTGSSSSTASRSVLAGALSRGPLEPTIVTTWGQFMALYGSWNGDTNNDAAVDAAYTFFSNVPAGGSALTVLRLDRLGSVSASGTVNGAEGASFVATAIAPGTWGNGIAIAVTSAAETAGFDPAEFEGEYDIDTGALADQVNIAVTLTIDDVVVRTERYRNVSMYPQARNFAPAIINGSSTLISIVPNAAVRKPSTATVSLSGGGNGTDVVFDLTPLDSIINPLTIYAANVHGLPSGVATLTNYVTERGDSFAILDTTYSSNTADMDVVQESVARVSAFAAVYYPWIKIVDPQRGAANIRKEVAPGGSVLGVFASTDSRYGVWKSPAGTTAALATAVEPVRKLKAEELDTLNTGIPPINAIRTVASSGVCIMGARTMDGSNADRYVSVRRSLSYIVANLNILTEYALFQPNGPDLWLDLTAKLEDWLGRYYQQGALRGAREDQAFYVKVDATNNTAQTIAAGEVHIEVGVAVEFPAEFVVIRLSQNQGSIQS